jgi:hypothetical protein
MVDPEIGAAVLRVLLASAACVACGFLVGSVIHWLTRET